MAVTNRIASSRQLAERWSTNTDIPLSAQTTCQRLLQRGLRAKVPLYRNPLMQNHLRLRLHGLINIDRGVPIGNKSSFPLKNTLIWGTVISASALDATPVNTTFRNTLSNVIQDERQV